jgi:membrane protein DedA with SNARE-associated domain
MFDIQLFVQSYPAYAYAAVFGMLLLCGFGLPVPEDISLVAGGIIAGMGFANVHLMALIAFAGVMIGDSAIYQMGHLLGDRLLTGRFTGRFFLHNRFEQAKKHLKAHGTWIVFAARFMPGLRAPVFATAGITGFVTFRRFFFTDGLAALLTVPFWVYVGFFGSSERERLAKWLVRGKWGFFALALFAAGFVAFRIFLKRKVEQIPGNNHL